MRRSIVVVDEGWASLVSKRASAVIKSLSHPTSKSFPPKYIPHLDFL